MTDPADEAKGSMESLSWPDTSRPIVNYGSSDPGGFARTEGSGYPDAAEAGRRRWPVVIAILVLLAIAVVAVIWIF